MKKIYRSASDLNGVPNGMWKMYALDLLKHGPIEADLATGSVHLVGEEFYYKDGVLHGSAGQQKTDEVLIPTEVIDAPSKATSAPQPRKSSPTHQIMRAIIGQQILERGLARERAIRAREEAERAWRFMTAEQRKKALKGGGR